MAVSRRLLRAAAREGYTHGSICNGRSVAADGFAGARGRRADQTSVGFEARDRTDGFTRERNGCEPVWLRGESDVQPSRLRMLLLALCSVNRSQIHTSGPTFRKKKITCTFILINCWQYLRSNYTSFLTVFVMRPINKRICSTFPAGYFVYIVTPFPWLPPSLFMDSISGI